MNRRVLVTGGASGIGAAICSAFLHVGDEVTSLDRTTSTDPRVASVVGDVRSTKDQRLAVDHAAGDGGLDVLIANAGIHDGGLTLEGAPLEVLLERFRHVLEVDVVGYLISLRAAADALREARGCAVLTLSDASFDVQGNGAGVAYVTAKHAALGLVRAAARDLAPDVRVNAVAPGGVATSLSAGSDGESRRVISDPEALSARLRNRTLLARGATLDQIASAYLYLASPPAAAITGQILRVDSGLLP